MKWISKSREQSVCLHTITHNMWKQMEKRLEKNKDRLVVYHSTNSNTESTVSESSRGKSFISGEKKIVHEENMILPPVPQEEPQCVSTL